MAFNEQLAQRVREALVNVANVEEKVMFSGLTFMVNSKMCIGVRSDEIMCRISPELQETALSHNGTTEMIHNGRTMKGFIFVNKEVLQSKQEFDYWINLSLAYNKEAKPAKKKKN